MNLKKVIKVAWIHVDRQTLLTLHTHVITHNPRVSVSHTNHRTWVLEIKQVQFEDKGYYMCQINTQPMKSQVVPPEFVSNHTLRNVTVMENANVTLSCKARGNPTPKIRWIREGYHPFTIGKDE
ncbi:hypothetical protein LAZ67_19000603, partial [Cordylochernes scorpioides]